MGVPPGAPAVVLGPDPYRLEMATSGDHERSARVQRTVVSQGGSSPSEDHVIVEEPLEVRLDGNLVGTTMRTPGHDFELAVGLCHSDGLLAGANVTACRYLPNGGATERHLNVVSVDTGGLAPVPTPRLGTTSSSCGVCGSTMLEHLDDRLLPLDPQHAFDAAVLHGVAGAVREATPLFDETGGVHSAAAFDVAGSLHEVREDIGRHNAVDKVVGRLLLDGALPATDLGLFVSGRASYEMVQKAWAAGFGLVVSVSAPSALAVQTAQRSGQTLVGFLRDGSASVYAGRLADR